jgi:hypothetical protein
MPERIVPTVFLLAAFVAFAMHGCAKSRQDEAGRQLAARVRTEFLHAWGNYERYAWGQDALRPLSKTGHDWYGQSLLMTPVDALDTLILMHLDAEAAKARSLVVSDLSFDRDIYVKNFEITIRLLGGLLSSYQLTGDQRLLSLAEDLGNQFTDWASLCLRQSSHWPDTRFGDESRRNWHAAIGIWHSEQTDWQDRFLRESKTRVSRDLQAAFATRPRWAKH